MSNFYVFIKSLLCNTQVHFTQSRFVYSNNECSTKKKSMLLKRGSLTHLCKQVDSLLNIVITRMYTDIQYLVHNEGNNQWIVFKY